MSPVIRGAEAARFPATPQTSGAGSLAGAAKGKPGQVVTAESKKEGTKGAAKIRGNSKMVQRDVPAFSRQLAAMLSAGMPIVASLETLEEQAGNPKFKLALAEVRKSIENGSSFSEALEPMPTIFDELYVSMVRSGERSGQLAETMRRIATLLENSAKLRRKVKSAMTYPTVVLCLALVIATGMILFIVPVFAEMFASFGSALPGPTQFLVDLSKNMKSWAPIVVPAIIAGVWGFKKWKATEKGRLAMDGFFLRAPVFGILVQKVAIARFSRTLGQLVQSGVPILGALEIVSKATGNTVVGQAILQARAAVEKGETMSSGLANKPGIPMLLVRMMQAGEKTGKVDEMLESIADTYDDEVETMLAGLTSMLEPLLMVVLGVIIGGIVVCMFLPIFKIGQVVGG